MCTGKPELQWTQEVDRLFSMITSSSSSCDGSAWRERGESHHLHGNMLIACLRLTCSSSALPSLQRSWPAKQSVPWPCPCRLLLLPCLPLFLLPSLQVPGLHLRTATSGWRPRELDAIWLPTVVAVSGFAFPLAFKPPPPPTTTHLLN